jgi:hypothetical protein
MRTIRMAALAKRKLQNHIIFVFRTKRKYKRDEVILSFLRHITGSLFRVPNSTVKNIVG